MTFIWLKDAEETLTMMMNTLFVISLGTMLFFLLRWGFKVLPKEKWQMAAVVPREKNKDGDWAGLNLTYYGVFSANAYVFATAVMIILLGALSVPLAGGIAVVILVLMLCIPASRIIARVVEKKPHTFSVGGASFVGIVITPWLVYLANATFGQWFDYQIPVMVFMAAGAIAYAFGEGLGRLACVSFGCCFGKPLTECHCFLRKLFARRCFIFSGKTKKIAYASGLDGVEVIPIQAITSVLFVTTGLVSMLLFFSGHYNIAFILSLAVTQLWRVVSEFFRLDFRGDKKFTTYQKLALAAGLYSAVIGTFFSVPENFHSDIITGLHSLWHPGVLLFLQGIWVLTFLYTGRSMVTNAVITFGVNKARI